MNPRDLEKLLGGYAAGTLTESEHGELMRAALEDQQIFDALADEEALRDALADPAFRARLRARLAPPVSRGLRWMWWLAPAVAAGLALFFVVNRPARPPLAEMASLKSPAPSNRSVEAPAAKTPGTQPSEAASPPEASQRASAVKPPAAAPPPAETPRPFVPPRVVTRDEPLPAAAPPPVPEPARLPSAVAESVALSAAAPAVATEKKAAAGELRKATTEADAAVALELQVERAIDGRFEATEVGALRRGDRVRFRVRPPEAGILVMATGSSALTVSALAGRTYYLPGAAGLPPGDAPVDIAIWLRPAIGGELGNLFRARQQAAAGPAGTTVSPIRPGEVTRDVRREDFKDKEEAAAQLQPAPRVVHLRLVFPPR